jgi:glycerol-3-phosphate dehydrogenase
MQRDLLRLVNQTFDLVVIGGGIYGACIARDAALRGLTVALIEQQDFGHATSANSLKIIHGGLRYVQDANLGRVRLMARERSTWLRVAPHLIQVLPCLLPTSHHLNRSKVALSVALAASDVMSLGLSGRAGSRGNIPPGRIISRSECLRLLPGLASTDVTGGATWHDAQIYNSERLLLSLILSAAQAGAAVANYLQATGFIYEGDAIAGVTARDVLAGHEVEIRGRMVVNSTGAWINSILGSVDGRALAPRFPLSIAINLVTRQILPEWAVGLPAQLRCCGNARNDRSPWQLLFMAPWRGYSLIGTAHCPYTGSPQAYTVPESVIEAMLLGINRAYPPAKLERSDVYHVHAGFLPMTPDHPPSSRVKLMREGRVHDHWKDDHLGGLITVVGVKYTAARQVAEEAVNLVVERLGRSARPCQTQTVPVWGGAIDGFEEFRAHAAATRALGLAPHTLEHLAHTYGSHYGQILEYVANDPALGQTLTPSGPVIRAEVVHAIRNEMATTLADVMLRRTELGAAGVPDAASLKGCADLMSIELGWSPVQTEREVANVLAAFPSAGQKSRASTVVA